MASDTAKKRFIEALEAYQSEQFEHAKKICDDILHEEPNFVDALHLRGIIAGQEGNYIQGIGYLTKAIGIDLHSPILHNNLANFYYKQKDFTEAKRHYHEAIAREPRYVDAHYNLGLLALKESQFDEAIEHFQNTLQLDPEHAPSLQKLADIFLHQEKIDESITYYQRVLAIEPYLEESLNNLGAAYLKKDNFIEAIKCFTTLLRLDENNPIARSNLASTLIQQHRYRDAAWHYQELLRQTPHDAEAHYNLGVAFLHLGELSTALEQFQETLKLQPHHMDAQDNLGVTLLKLGRKEEAAKAFQTSLQLQPHNPAVQYLHDAITGKVTPEQAPPDYVTALFDTYADHYDQHLTESLHYEAPILLRKLFEKVAPLKTSLVIVDLGCGTGLSGEAFRSLASRLIGVDLSSRMIDIAQSKNIYHELITADVVTALKQYSLTIDLIIAADVLVYMGDLSELFTACFNALHTSGFLIFSTEISEQEDYVLQPSARYAHSKQYIEKLAKRSGFNLLGFEKVILRTQENQPLYGHLFVYGKNKQEPRASASVRKLFN